MGILTLGLLGVAALFPVGGYYMQKAEISDRGSAIAQSVMNDIMAKGMLNPGSWIVIVPWSGDPAPANAIFPSDGKYAPGNLTPTKARSTFSRPFALSLADALNQPGAATDPTLIGKQFGSALVIDPMGLAAMSFPGAPPQPSRHGATSTFPATGYRSFGSFYPTYATSPWYPWSGMWPIRRVTFREPSTAWQMNATTAEHFFRASDDLATDLPQRDDRPALQNWDSTVVGGEQKPLARQWTGDYSWIVSVVPTTNAARDGMARNPEGNAYDVSVVVFHKRVLPADAQTVFTSTANLGEYFNAQGENERAVRATVISAGPNGGELLLTDLRDNTAKSPFEGLKSGEWIMFCGPHPNSTMSDPRLVLNWYQVMAIEGKDTRLNSEGTETPAPPTNDPERRLVALRGPEWPWQPAANLTSNDLSNNLCVGICRGAVAVHTKTLRLENPRSSPVSFGVAGDPKLNPPGYNFP